MHFVTFHVEPSAPALDKISASCHEFNAETDYRRLLGILFRSIQLFHPGATQVVLSDERTALNSLPPEIAVRRSAVDPDRVMYSRLLAQIDYVRNHGSDSGVVFLDSDMIVNADLRPLLDADFDVALTYRDHPRMPLNGGVIFIKGGPHGAGLRFLERVRSLYAERFSAAGHWWGDQQALIAAVGHERFAQRIADWLMLDGVRMRLLPCEQYNFTPPNSISAIAAELPAKAILHFKGACKRLMPLYWNTHLAARAAPGEHSRLNQFWRRKSLSLRGYSEQALALAQSGAQLSRKFAGKVGLVRRKKAG